MLLLTYIFYDIWTDKQLNKQTTATTTINLKNRLDYQKKLLCRHLFQTTLLWGEGGHIWTLIRDWVIFKDFVKQNWNSEVF